MTFLAWAAGDAQEDYPTNAVKKTNDRSFRPKQHFHFLNIGDDSASLLGFMMVSPSAPRKSESSPVHRCRADSAFCCVSCSCELRIERETHPFALTLVHFDLLYFWKLILNR